MSIRSNMKEYNYSTYSQEDAYGQKYPAAAAQSVVMAIYENSSTKIDGLTYKDAQYIGLTYNEALGENCLVVYGDKKLKVLTRMGNQVFLQEVQ